MDWMAAGQVVQAMETAELVAVAVMVVAPTVVVVLGE